MPAADGKVLGCADAPNPGENMQMAAENEIRPDVMVFALSAKNRLCAGGFPTNSSEV
jgi:hypothetical protein